VIIQPGLSKNGLHYSPEALEAAIPLFEGMHVFYFDDDAAGHKPDPRLKQPGKMVGWIDNVRKGEDGSIIGDHNFLQGGAADPIRTQVYSAWTRGKRDLFGLSIDARGLTKPATIDGKPVKDVKQIGHVLSTDIVLHPAAGGGFSRLLESAQSDTSHTEAKHMSKRARLIQVLESRRPSALAGVDRNTVGIGDLIEIASETELQEAFAAAPAGGESVQASTGAAGTSAHAPSNPAIGADAGATALQEARQIESRIMLRDALQESRLPKETQTRITQLLAGRVLTDQQIQEAIASERNYLAQMAPARVQGLGAERQGVGVSVGAEKIDRLQAGFDRSFGLTPENAELATVKPLSLRGLYNEITAGGDPDVSGFIQESTQQAMLQEAFTNATLPSIVANTMHRRLVRDYREVDYGERRIVSMVGSASDFRTQEAIRVGYFGDIPTVDPESADYAELAAYGQEAANYAVGQRGAIVTITRRHIINDDVGHVAKVIGRLGRAARRTFARFVWDLYRTNAVITIDGTAWFTVGHKNLLAEALSPAGLTAARNALYNQTEPGSGERLALEPYLLVVPIELEGTAISINESQLIPGSTNNDANRWFRKFGASNENIIVNPFLTDSNDWGVFANPADVDTIEIRFLNGAEEPELFTADSPTVGQMFTADKLQYKIRHEYGGTVVDYRGAVKSQVA
jgi:hypothetical protein